MIAPGNLAGLVGHDPAAVRSAAIEYASRGWRVVVLHGIDGNQCTCGDAECQLGGKRKISVGKHPRLGKWEQSASSDAAVVGQWFDRWPHSNVGIMLGPSSGIIDLESDSAEGEQLFRDWFGGTIPRTPAFTSGRGTHRLFRYRDDLPQQAAIPLGCADLKIGAGTKIVEGVTMPLGTQSVFPPSWHYSGCGYQWIVTPDECEVAVLPDDVLVAIKRHVEAKAGNDKPGNDKPGSRLVFNDQPLDTSPSVEAVLRKLRKSRNAAKFSALYDLGDTSAYRNNASDADMGLCSRIAFYAGRDAALIDQIFRSSKLMRDKWDERRGDSTYGRNTIERVLGKKNEFYDWNRKAKSNGSTKASSNVEPTAASEAEPEGGVEAAQAPQAWQGALPQVWLPDGATTISAFAGVIGGLMAATGRYFSRGGVPMRAIRDEHQHIKLEPLKPASAVSDFESVARLMRTKTTPSGEVYDVPAICSEAIARAVVASSAFNDVLPPIKVVSRCPVLIERGGQLVTISGYDRDAAILAMGQAPIDVSLVEARSLFDLLLCDFQFADEGDKSRAAASFITAAMVLGGLLGGRAPADLGEADDSQSGKGYRAKLLTTIYRHAARTITQRERGVGSIQEAFDASLVAGSAFVSLDNLRGSLDFAWLESFLTEPTYSARVPYASPVEIDTSRTIVSLTTNKAELNRDLANRSSVVRIRKRGDGYQFKRYVEGDLLAHVEANQSRFLGAIFAIIREWHRQGKPAITQTAHDFRRWNGVLGWIVENVLGLAPLMQGHRDVQARITSPALNWLRDVAFAVRDAGRLDEWLRAHHLVDLVLERGIETQGIDLELDTDDQEAYMKATRAMGRKLTQAMTDKRVVEIDGMKIEREDRDDGHARQKREVRISLVSPIVPNASPIKTLVSPISPMGADTLQNSEADTSSVLKGCAPIGGIGENGIALGETHRCSIRPEDWEQRGDSKHCPICGAWKGRATRPT